MNVLDRCEMAVIDHGRQGLIDLSCQRGSIQKRYISTTCKYIPCVDVRASRPYLASLLLRRQPKTVRKNCSRSGTQLTTDQPTFVESTCRDRYPG